MVEKTKEKQRCSERIVKEKEELFSATPRVDIERLKFLLEVYQEAEGQPPVIQRARLFDRLCSEKTIFIDNNPIVGSLTRYKYGGYPYLEAGARWMKKAKEFSLLRGNASITEGEKVLVARAADFWWDRNEYNKTREIILETRGIDIGVIQKCGVGTSLTPGSPTDTIPDYSIVLNRGLKGIITEIEDEKKKLDTVNSEDLSKYYFYKGALICLNGMIRLARRYASLAREKIGNEKDTGGKLHLERIVGTCDRVPASPARNFHEALQSVWFTILGVWFHVPFHLVSPLGNFSQYMYPFFKKDKEAGMLTDEQAIELLQFLFLKINGLSAVLPPHAYAWSQSRLGMHLCIGGITSEGDDATNELDYLVLEAQERIRLPEPLVDLIYHDKLSDQFLLKCIDLIRTGIGQPAFHNVEKAIARHLYHEKMPLEDARNVSILGCVQSIIPGCTATPWEGMFNTAKTIELVLNNGKDPLSGIQLGLQSGEAESYQSYNELYGAVIKQIEYFVPLLRAISHTSWNIERDFPVPFASAVTNDCIKNGKDLMDGGARYHGANGISFVAVVDLANSLAAIRKLVFEDKKITLKILKEALAADFEGYGDIHHMCLNAPKYGNDDDYADAIVKDLYNVCYREHQRFADYLGRPSKPEAYSVTVHFATGRFTGALPSGRLAGTPLTDGSVSATPGTDKNGPTALARSAARVIDTVKFGGNHLNMKFHPAALKGINGARKCLSLIKTYFDLGGYHVQFNCVGSETLKNAQTHPEEYRDLVVRVAGFSAFFVHLDPAVQNEIINRTELSFN